MSACFPVLGGAVAPVITVFELLRMDYSSGSHLSLFWITVAIPISRPSAGWSVSYKMLITQNKHQCIERKSRRVRFPEEKEVVTEHTAAVREKKSGKEWRKEQAAKRMETRRMEKKLPGIESARNLVKLLEKVETDKPRFFNDEEVKPEIEKVMVRYTKSYNKWKAEEATKAADTSTQQGTPPTDASGSDDSWKPLMVRNSNGDLEPLAQIDDLRFTSYLKSLEDRARFEEVSTFNYVTCLESVAGESGFFDGDSDSMSTASSRRHLNVVD